MTYLQVNWSTTKTHVNFKHTQSVLRIPQSTFNFCNVEYNSNYLYVKRITYSEEFTESYAPILAISKQICI